MESQLVNHIICHFNFGSVYRTYSTIYTCRCMQNSDQDKTNFENFLRSLITKFRNDEKLLDRRCSFIIQTLCAHVDSEKVYKYNVFNFSKLLQSY